MRRLFSALALILFGILPAAAQLATQQAATRLDAASQVCAVTYSSGTSLAVNVQSTATCTPAGGQFFYITGISFDVCTDGTGTAANQVTFTSTNLTGSPLWSFSIAATASICQHWEEPLSTPLKSTAAGTAVTIVSPAAATHNSYYARVYGYSAP